MKNRFTFDAKTLLWDILVPLVLFLLLAMLNKAYQHALDFVKPDYSVVLVTLLYLLLGVYFNKRRVLSLFRHGRLEIQVNSIMMSLIFLLIAFCYPWPWVLVYSQFINSIFMQALYAFFFPLYSAVKGNIIMILLGYFLAGIFRKVPPEPEEE